MLLPTPSPFLFKGEICKTYQIENYMQKFIRKEIVAGYQSWALYLFQDLQRSLLSNDGCGKIVSYC